MFIIKCKSEKTVSVMQRRFMHTSDCPLSRMCKTASNTLTARNRARLRSALRRRKRRTKHDTKARFRAGVRNTPAVDRMITSHNQIRKPPRIGRARRLRFLTFTAPFVKILRDFFRDNFLRFTINTPFTSTH